MRAAGSSIHGLLAPNPYMSTNAMPQGTQLLFSKCFFFKLISETTSQKLSWLQLTVGSLGLTITNFGCGPGLRN